jgi:hypothetical protein
MAIFRLIPIICAVCASRVALKHPEWAASRVITSYLKPAPGANSADPDQMMAAQYHVLGKALATTYVMIGSVKCLGDAA